MNFTQSWPWLSHRYSKYYYLLPYYYRFNSAALAVNAQANTTLRAIGSATSMVMGVTHHASTAIAAGAWTSGDFSMALSVEDRDLQDGPIQGTLYGSGIYTQANLDILQGVTFPYPTTIQKGGYLRVVLTNGTVANNIIRLVFHSVLLRPKGDVEKIPGIIRSELRVA